MKKYRNLAGSIAGLLLLAALPQAARAATGTWNVDADGLWSNAANWTPSFADGSGFIANFTNNITADRTVSLDSARTLGSLVFGDSNTATAGSWILGNNGNAANTLTGLTAITVNALGTGKTATISAVIAGSASRIELNGSGGGTLVLAGANTFNFTTNNANFGWRLNSGSTVVVASDSAFGVSTPAAFDYNASTLVNLNGGTVQASGSARTVANPLWLNGSTTVVSGSQSLTFSGAAMGRGNNATVTNNITGGGTLSFTGNVYTDQTTGFKNLTFNGTGNTIISGNISNNTAGTNTAGAITKSGAGTLTLSGTNSYSGATAVSAGTLLVNSPGSLHANSAVSVANTAILGGSGTINGTVTVNTGGTILLGASSATLTLANSTAPSYPTGSNYSTLKILASASTLDKISASATTGNSVANLDLIIDTTGLSGDVASTTIYSAGGAITGPFHSVTVIGNTAYTAIPDYSTSAQIKLALTTASGTPTITTAGTLSALSTTYGTASTPTSFTVSGVSMTAGITVTPPAGFEVSKTVGGASGYAGSGTAITVGSSGTIASTTVYVRLAATATVGSSPYSGNITCTSTGATPVDVATVSSTVAPANLTLTANDQTKIFGATQTTPVTGSTAFTSSGLMNGDTVGTVTLDYSAGALDAGDLPGATSTITPSAATGGTFNPSNYNTIGYNPGTLTVLAVPAITLGGSLGVVDTTYGTPTAAPTSFTVSATDLVPASGNLTVTPPAGYEVTSGAGYSTSLSVPYTGSMLSSTTVSVRLAATTAVNGGAGYTGDITVAGGGASSQTIATVSSTVAPANLTITADNQNKAYNTTQPSPVTGSAAFTTSGLMNGQTVSTVTLTYGTGALDPSDAVGATSTITPSTAAGTLNAGNYNISYVPGTLTVVKATPTATLAVNNSPVTYNGSAQAATVGITVSSVTGTVQNIQTGGAANQTNAGTYAVTADFVPDDTTNYNTLSTQPAGNFVINKATAVVVVTPYTVTYDGNPKTATVTSITGVNGETGATVGTVTLNTTHTTAGTYASDSWTFTGTANYNDIGATTSSITVTNGSFETRGALNNATFWWSLGSPWVGGISPQGYEVLQVNQFNTFTAAADGLYALNLESWLVSVTQNLSTTVNAGDTLSMTFSGGRAKAGSGALSNGGKFTATFKVGTTEYTSSEFDTGLQANDTWQSYTFTTPITNTGTLSIIFKPVSGRPWVDNISNVSRTIGTSPTLTNTINKATPTATLAVNNSPVTYDGTPKAATVGVTASSVPGSAQNILTGGAATQTAAGTYAVTANFVPTDTTNYNTLTALSAGNFIIENNNNYDDWALANGVTGGVNGDSNNDGVQNGVAYFMGVTGQATNPSLNASNQVTWPVNPNFQGTFEVQISSDLIIWTPASPQPTPSAGNLTYTLPSGLGKQFVRLVVTPN